MANTASVEVAGLPRSLNDVPIGSDLDKLINSAYEVDLRRLTGGGIPYSAPYLTIATVGFANPSSTSSKYRFVLSETKEMVTVRWYSVRVRGMRHVGLAVGWCNSHPDGILFYQIRNKTCDHFKIWEGETDPADDNFSNRLLIMRSKVRGSLDTESGSGEMEVDSMQDDETEGATQPSTSDTDLQDEPTMTHIKDEPQQDETQNHEQRINVVFKTFTPASEDPWIIPWEHFKTNDHMFAAAVAARVLESSEQQSVLSVTIVSATGERLAMRILRFWGTMFEALQAKVAEVSNQTGAGAVELVVEKL